MTDFVHRRRQRRSSGPTSNDVADFNGDNVLDIATIDEGTDTVTVLLAQKPLAGARDRTNRLGREVPIISFDGGTTPHYAMLFSALPNSPEDEAQRRVTMVFRKDRSGLDQQGCSLTAAPEPR